MAPRKRKKAEDAPAEPSAYIEFDNWQDAPTDAESWPWINFTPRELACRHTGKLKLHRPTMDRLQAVRTEFGLPMPVTSGFRDPSHPVEARKRTKSGAHTTGRAFDVQVSGGELIALHAIAHKHGFTGFGWKQTGPHDKRFLHIDDLEGSDHQPRPTGWSY